ncbi:MAG: hypothetical protein ACREUQ_07425 [Burkholderiales bacterium]
MDEKKGADTAKRIAATDPSDLKTLVDAPVHCLYVGVTMTGKTTLARLHARLLAQNKYDVIVYDPVGTETAGGGWPEEATVFDDERKFFDHVKSAQDAYVFVDEAPDVFNLGKPHNHWILRRGRHQGLYVRAVSQRPTMIAPNARTQCAIGYVFRMAPEDAYEVFADFGHARATARESTEELDEGDFVVIESGRPAIAVFNVFDLIGRKRQ